MSQGPQNEAIATQVPLLGLVMVNTPNIQAAPSSPVDKKTLEAIDVR